MWQLLNPFPDVRPDHPLIVRESRRRWLKRAGSPGRYSAKVILIVLAIVLVLFLGWWILHWLQPSTRFYRWSFYGILTDFLLVLGGVSLLASVLLDYASITASLNVISGEINNGTWDLLRLTAIREGELVLAKHAVTQLRVWRTTMCVIGLRLAATLTVAIITALDFVLAASFGEYRTAPENITFFLFNIVPFAVLFGVFILEPLWRMRMMTSLGMVISSRLRDGASAALLAIGMVLALWLVQTLVVIAVIAGLSALFLALSVFGVSALCAPFTMLFVVFPTVYGFYSILKTWGLRQVARRLFVLT